MPNKVLKLLKNDISEECAVLFNLSFTTDTFQTILKTAKVIPIYKKDSKLDFVNYRPISLLSNLDEVVEKIMHSKLTLSDTGLIELQKRRGGLFGSTTGRGGGGVGDQPCQIGLSTFF